VSHRQSVSMQRLGEHISVTKNRSQTLKKNGLHSKVKKH